MQDYGQLLSNQQIFFQQQKTKPIAFRLEILGKLKTILKKHESEILQALNLDLKKCSFEAYGTELGVLFDEISVIEKNLKKWSKPKRVKTNMLNLPGSSYIYSEPYGAVLVMGAWNYPFNLSLMPCIGALAAGNTCVIKPSEFAPHTSRLVAKIINNNFDPKLLTVVEGDVNVASALLDLPWNYIFFTGSPQVGAIVYQKAAKHLTPVTLELGGKSPCIVAEDANLEVAAKKIVWGKFTNAGQTCVAPDFLILHENIKDEFIKLLNQTIKNFFGDDPRKSPDYGRISSKAHWQRLMTLMTSANIILPSTNAIENELYIAPTIVADCQPASPLMKDEIFGPILPCLTYRDEQSLHTALSIKPKPLAFYVFSKNTSFCDQLINRYSFGGGCVNDVLMHLSNTNLPFGGVGGSGLGQYHGKKSFDTFTHEKGILKQFSWFNVPLRYPPYEKKFSLLKFMMR